MKWSVFAASVCVGLVIASPFNPTAEAQSLSIQSWQSFGVPRSGISFGVPYGGLGVPGYHSYRHGFLPYGGRSGFSLSIGIPRSYGGYGYGRGYAHPYDRYRYQNDYFDYRTDYYHRLYDSYRRGLQQDLYSAYPEYGYGGIDPFGSALDYPSYRPPAATIEPFGSHDPSSLAPYGDIQALLTPHQAVTPQRSPAIDVPAANLPQALRAAANRLSISLSRRADDGDVWLEYLAPGRIIAAIDQGQSSERMAELLRHYDGVTANGQLRSIATADGFELTRRLLRQWIESAEAAETRRNEAAAPEPLQAPEPPRPDVDPPMEPANQNPVHQNPANQNPAPQRASV